MKTGIAMACLALVADRSRQRIRSSRPSRDSSADIYQLSGDQKGTADVAIDRIAT